MIGALAVADCRWPDCRGRATPASTVGLYREHAARATIGYETSRGFVQQRQLPSTPSPSVVFRYSPMVPACGKSYGDWSTVLAWSASAAAPDRPPSDSFWRLTQSKAQPSAGPPPVGADQQRQRQGLLISWEWRRAITLVPLLLGQPRTPQASSLTTRITPNNNHNAHSNHRGASLPGPFTNLLPSGTVCWPVPWSRSSMRS